jgi:uncharacterized membrane protein YgcG
MSYRCNAAGVRNSSLPGRLLSSGGAIATGVASIGWIAVRTLWRTVPVALIGLFVVLGLAGPALAASTEEIRTYNTQVEVRPDGTMRVTETIAYDFGPQDRHGIIREIPARFHYDDLRDRVYPIEDVTVTRDGQPEPVERSSSAGGETLKIGDANRLITGVHTYVIGYTVQGALNHFADHEELYWNVVGSEWQVPILAATATIRGPGAVTRVGCFSGPTGSQLGCAQAVITNGAAQFSQAGLGNGAGMSAVVAFPVGSVSHVEPILVDRHDPAAAFHVSWVTAGIAVGLAVLGVAGALLLVWRDGRDRRYVGLLPGLSPEPGESAEQERKPLTGAPPVSVEFGPPDKLRPGQVGTLVDETANVVDVTASIVDLAVRKYLHIKELSDRDYELTKLRPAGPEMLAYERELFDALFAEGDQVRLSELRGHFAQSLARTQRQLYADMVAHGWYPRSPATTRLRARGFAILALVGAIVVTVVLALTTHVALIGLGLVAAAITLLIVAPYFPARTGAGSAALARIQGFRLFIATAQVEQFKFEERANIFSEYLPYAMVFGLASRWANVFGDLAEVAPDGLDWYSGRGAFTTIAFVASFNHFSSVAAGTVTTAAMAVHSGTVSSSGFSGFSAGGGFSGGGVGGGGGGSW